MPNDLVSIIIPCYNQAQYLEEAVQSAVDQTYPNIEIIIINDGSTDNSEEIASHLQKQYPEKIRIILQENSGVSAARNNAIEQSKGKYILPLDADDLINLEMVKSSLKAMIDSKADIVYVDTQCFGTKNHLIRKLSFSENNFLYENLCNVTSLFKKDIWITLNGYTENMDDGYEDWEFWVNAYKEGYKFQLLSEPLLLYRTQKESRNTKAVMKDAYLKAKIIMNNPELYTVSYVRDAIETIKEHEQLANYYFYHSKDISNIEEILWIELGTWLSNNILKEKQTIPISNKQIRLCSLDLYENKESMQHVSQDKHIDLLIFYAPLRYEIATLRCSDFAWTEGKGIEPAKGNVFPFVPKSIRENPDTQLIAYQRLAEYQKKQIKTLEKKVSLAEQAKKNSLKQQKETIRLQHKTIEEKTNLLQNSYQAIVTQKSVIDSIKKVINLPIIEHPILKYKAYKYMVNTYYKYSNKQEDLSRIDKGITPHDMVFLIPTCKKYVEKTNAIRSTWAKQLTTHGFRYYFLMGNPKLKQAKLENDILYVPCEDDYESLLLKLVLGYEFLYQNMDFTYVYKIDDDCFPDLNKLISILLPQFSNKKYIGGAIHPKDGKMSNNWHFGKCNNPKFDRPYKFDVAPFEFAKGGYGYFLRKDILPMLFELKDKLSSELEKHIYSPEDVRITEILKNNGILVDHINSYSIIPASNYNNSNQYLVYDIQNPELMQLIERDRVNKGKLSDLDNYVEIEKHDTAINFIVKSKSSNKKVAFYLYKNDKRIDIQWYSKEMSYILDKKIHTAGTYKVKYFLVDESDINPVNSTKKEIGESETIYID